MPSKATYGDFRKSIDRHLRVISRLEEKLRKKQEQLWMLQGTIQANPDETSLSGADEAEMLRVEQSSDALDPISNPEEIWPC